jgi:hypothetical protein
MRGMIIGLMPGGPAFWTYMAERWYPKSCENIWTVVAKISRVPSKAYGMGPQILESLYHWSLEQDSFSVCMLVEDENDILNRWIAHHMKMAFTSNC